MPFPNFAGKHQHEPLVTPIDILAHRRARGFGERAAGPVPNGIVLCYQSSVLARILAEEATELWVRSSYDVRLIGRTEGRVGIVGGFGIGAPVAGIVLEELVALGVRRFVSIGTAGGLQLGHAIGDIILCTGAVRDEGVSHHYLDPMVEAAPSAPLTDRLREALRRQGTPFGEGRSWTIDTPYRETVAEVRHYRELGVATVEMEAAALFAVAAHRGVEVAAAFAISDSLADLIWDPQFGSPAVSGGLDRLADAAIAALEDGNA